MLYRGRKSATKAKSSVTRNVALTRVDEDEKQNTGEQSQRDAARERSQHNCSIDDEHFGMTRL